MLVLSRQVDEKLVLDFSGITDEDIARLKANPIIIQLTAIRRTSAGYRIARIGIEAPDSVGIDRDEIYRAKKAKAA